MSGHSKTAAFDNTGYDSPINEVAFALLAHKDGAWRPCGTAVSVGSNLLITAKHNVQYYWDHFGDGGPLKGSLHLECTLFARQMLNGGKDIAIWRVTKTWTSPLTDLAYLYVNPASEPANRYTRWLYPALQLEPPQEGDRVSAFGFHSPEIHLAIGSDPLKVTWGDSPTTSVGEVISVHPIKRDNCMLTFPCFQTNSHFENSMSGGPIFNDQGQVCGLVCTGIEGDEASGHTSYGILLWPALGTLMNGIAIDGIPPELVRAFDIAKAGYIKAFGLERLFLEPHESGVHIKFFPTHGNT